MLPIEVAKEKACSYLLKAVDMQNFFMRWDSNYPETVPAKHSYGTLDIFYLTLALRTSGQLPENTKSILKHYLFINKTGDNFRFSPECPIDADDTAYRCRALLLLGEPVQANKIFNCFDVFKKGPYFLTLLECEVSPQYDIREITEGNINPFAGYGFDPEVNANVQLCFKDYGVLYDQAIVFKFPRENNLYKSFYYPSLFYNSWLVSMLSEEEGVLLPLGSEICRIQNQDGGWGATASNAFDTALSILALTKIPVVKQSLSIYRGIQFLIRKQKTNGSWESGKIWEYYLILSGKQTVWIAIDVNCIVTTSLALIAICHGSYYL